MLLFLSSLKTKIQILIFEKFLNGEFFYSFTASDITIRVGSSDHEQGGTLFQAKTLNSPAEYNPTTNDFDVAIIELEKEIEEGDTSKVIAPVDAEPAPDTAVLVSGWGTLAVSLKHEDFLFFLSLIKSLDLCL